MFSDDQIVMTPTKRSQDLTTVTVERLKNNELDQNRIVHKGGGDHTGLIIYKETGGGTRMIKPPELVLGFNVKLRSFSSRKEEQEIWQLMFWFKAADDEEKIESAEAFLTELIPPKEQKGMNITSETLDYIGFIKKIMKLLQMSYDCIQKVEVEMRKLPKETETRRMQKEVEVKKVQKEPEVKKVQKEVEVRKAPKEVEVKKVEIKKPPREVVKMPPPTPANPVENKIVHAKMSAEQEKLLDIIEAVYPNSLSVPTIAKSSNVSDEEAQEHLIMLQSKGLVKCLSNGNYMRTTKNDADVKMVKQIPMVAQAKQPVIAIITAQYCEKLAVDAMIENKETFVKFKTEGESTVYTLGTIGRHRVVSTKLPAIGMARGAMIAAGSTTTRLLGSFPRVDYVFLVGVGGGVPHCHDYAKHVRLGDVIVSTPPPPDRQQKPFIYMHCETVDSSPEQMSIKTWCPPSFTLQNIASGLWSKGLRNMADRPWEESIEGNLGECKDREASFYRPPPDTDKIYCLADDSNNLVDVAHPQPPEGSFDPRKPGFPVLHFGAVGSGKILMADDTRRLSFADDHGIVCFDTGFGSVVESIFGNRKDDYVFIRGVADYKDGTKKKEWQPFAALAAAAVMKAVIDKLEV